MLRQIRYFQAVVRSHSFSEAAEECCISQSAISQQIQALERELGFPLLERRNRSFVLTPAGEYVYRKSRILLTDWERIRREADRIARTGEAVLKVGLLRDYGGTEFCRALERFAAGYPAISVRTELGNHEELFSRLCSGEIDLALNDQRRAFSEEYVNLVLGRRGCCAELSPRCRAAGQAAVTLEELKGQPCILAVSAGERETEEAYCRSVLGVRGEFLAAESLESARLLALGGAGFLVADGEAGGGCGPLCRIPLFRGEDRLFKTYCAFWKKENSGYYVESFAEALREAFSRGPGGKEN